MPELPEVETVVRVLNAELAGRRIEKVTFLGKMRVPFDPKKVEKWVKDRRIAGVRRRAKYIIVECEGGKGLLSHLGMTGSFRIEPAASARGRHDRAAFRLDSGDELRYADARRFGFIKPVGLEGPGGVPAELDRLGPEPLERAFTGALMLERAKGRGVPVKTFIMDQAVVVGVGNIYANEALFAAGVDPRRPAASLDKEEWARTVKEIKAVLRRSIRRGGTTIRDYRSVTGDEGLFRLSLKVYGKHKEVCPKCGSGIASIRQGGRSTFFCDRCQR